LLKVVNPALEVTLRVMHKGRAVKVAVRADGSGLVSHVGSGLLRGLADRLGLARALGGLRLTQRHTSRR
jgi:glucose-6-phosphate-specific signal transduction histidine kinase